MCLGKAWEKRVLSNAHSFEEVYTANAAADPTLLEQVGAKMHEAAWATISSGSNGGEGGDGRSKAVKRGSAEL